MSIGVFVCFQRNDSLCTLLDDRISSLQHRMVSRPSVRKQQALLSEFDDFLSRLQQPADVSTCDVHTLLRFLAFKEISGKGKTQIHDQDCVNIGKLGVFDCDCPCRLSADYLRHIVGSLKGFFQMNGRGVQWDVASGTGNPAFSPEVHDYLLAVQDEQAEAHVVRKQVPPMTPEKLMRLTGYLLRESSHQATASSDKFLFLRDRAFFAIQFFLGERGGDLLKLLLQEIYRAKDDTGLIVRQTYGKQRQENIAFLPRCNSVECCPVRAMDDYITASRSLGLDLSTGYVFRKLSKIGTVLDKPLTQSGMSRRLSKYLSAIGIFEGETTHSLRGGAAVLLKLNHECDEQAAKHIGWKSMSVWEHYARSQVVESHEVAGTLARVFNERQDNVMKGGLLTDLDLRNLPKAYI